MLNISPRDSRVIVRPMAAESNAGPIEIPESAMKDKESFLGVITHLGPQCLPDLKIGQHVFYNGHDADDILIEGKEHRVTRDESIYAIIEL